MITYRHSCQPLFTASLGADASLRADGKKVRLETFFDGNEARHSRLSRLSIRPVMGRSMTVRAQCNHVPRVVRSAIRQSSDMMCFKIGRSIRSAEGGRRPAVLTSPLGPRIDVGANQLTPLKSIRRDLPLSRRHPRGCDSLLAQIREQNAIRRHVRSVISFQDCSERPKLKNDGLPSLAIGVTCISKVEILVHKLVFVLQARRNFPEYQDITPFHGMIPDCPVSSDHLHISGLTFSGVFEDAIGTHCILIAMGCALMAGDQEDWALGICRCNDPALLLTSKACMDICTPIVDPTLFKSPRHSIPPQSNHVIGEANTAGVNIPLTRVGFRPMAERAIRAIALKTCLQRRSIMRRAWRARGGRDGTR